MENLGNWGEAVGCARGIGDDSHVRGILVVVDSHHEDWGRVLWWGRDDSLLGSSLGVKSSLLDSGENTSALGNVVSTDRSPLDLGWVSLGEDADGLSVDLDATISLLDGSLELA